MIYGVGSNIDVPRLFTDLALTESVLEQIAALEIPGDVAVTSTSAIKTATVGDALRIIRLEEEFKVVGEKASSGVAEQPLGQTAVDGALNRLRNGIQNKERDSADKGDTFGWFSIENGLFRVARHGGLFEARDRSAEGVLQFTEGADLTPDYDPEADYEDRAVAAIRLPGYPTIVQISPGSEAVRFPKAAIAAAYTAPGGLNEHTAGSKLAEMGVVTDKQNPHEELTEGRPGGPLPRQDQMARVIIRALARLAGENDGS